MTTTGNRLRNKVRGESLWWYDIFWLAQLVLVHTAVQMCLLQT